MRQQLSHKKTQEKDENGKEERKTQKKDGYKRKSDKLNVNESVDEKKTLEAHLESVYAEQARAD